MPLSNRKITVRTCGRGSRKGESRPRGARQGKPYSVRYDQVDAMLLNEFLKEHRAFTQEQRVIVEQQKEIESLKAELKEQRVLIQKASDRLELKSSKPQALAHNH